MTTTTDVDRVMTRWLEGAGPATMGTEALDTALQIARRTSRRGGSVP